MFCPKCGKINPDSEEKCTGCGAVLHEEKTSEPVKNNKKTLKTVIAAILVVALVGAAVFFFCSCGKYEMPDLNDRITY